MLNVRYEYTTIVDISMRQFARYSHIANNIETYDICLKYSSKPEKNTIEMKPRMTDGFFPNNHWMVELALLSKRMVSNKLSE